MVLAEDVGVVVMLDVVRVNPVFASADDVPVVGCRVQGRIVHPVVLAVHHVVADFHVFQDLGVGQGQHADHPADRPEPEHQQAAAGHRTALSAPDHAPDMVGIALAEVSGYLGTQGIELVSQVIELLRVKLGFVGHRGIPWSVSVGQRSSSRSLSATVTQS
jgi:hypothetical protein